MCPVHVGVAKRIGRSVESRAFAVPHANDAIVGSGAFRQFQLTSPHRSGAEFFVDRGHQLHVMIGSEHRQSGQQLVQTREGAALIARYERCDAAARAAVTLVLFHQVSGDCLNPGHQHRTRIRAVLGI